MATLSESITEDDVDASDALETEPPEPLSAEANSIVSPVESVTSQNDLQTETQVSPDSPDLQLPASSLEPPVDVTSVQSALEMSESTQEPSSLNVARPASNPKIPQKSRASFPKECCQESLWRNLHTSECSADLGSKEIVEVSAGKPERGLEPEHTPVSPLSVKSATIPKFRYVTLDESRKQIAQYQVELTLANDETCTVRKRFSVFR